MAEYSKLWLGASFLSFKSLLFNDLSSEISSLFPHFLLPAGYFGPLDFIPLHRFPTFAADLPGLGTVVPVVAVIQPHYPAVFIWLWFQII